ncbi:MAG: carboxylesterase/lipase family protein [Acidobacteria bacterium]|nr:carboxylesterase/lipase family protein [Acidobacteriota bacterium]
MTDHCAPASDNAADTRHDGLDRRTLLTGAASALVAAAAAVAHAAPAEAAQSPAPATASGPLVVVTDRGPVVETTGGRVRGARMRDIHTFKGIPYGASTAGAGRFMPPVKVAPWTGVRSALHYGPVAPHGPRAGWAFDEEAFMFEWDDGVPSEDCLRVNVWTPGLDAKKRPVMVWIHGGGFAAGSSQELRAYDGERLARRGDVVVVSMNHRLNVLGYANLAAYGPQYASAGLAGMLDLVLALEWVRDNIANFGGDPGSVTIFGQSGGGSKVSTLMAMPAAKGLFHRAAVHSASSLRMNSADTSAKVAAAMLAELGLAASQVGTLQTMPFERLCGAAMAGLRKIVPADPAPSGASPTPIAPSSRPWSMDGCCPRSPSIPSPRRSRPTSRCSSGAASTSSATASTIPSGSARPSRKCARA